MLGLVALALAPAAVLVTFLYLKDRHEREPLRVLGRAFAAGCAAVGPALLFGLVGVRLGQFLGWEGSLWAAFVNAGLAEEAAKLWAVWWAAYRRPEFNEPMDGIVYAGVAALGFASVENLFYVLQGGVGTGVARALLAVPGHALFGVLMGYYLGRARFAPAFGARARLTTMALLVPTFFHGLYDTIAFNADRPLVGVMIIPLVALLWRKGLARMRESLAQSPFRDHISADARSSDSPK